MCRLSGVNFFAVDGWWFFELGGYSQLQLLPCNHQGWMDAGSHEGSWLLFSSTHIRWCQNIARKIFSNAITEDGWMPAFSFDHGCRFPSHTKTKTVFFLQSTKYTYPVCAWQILPKAHRTWGLRFEQSNFLIFKICIACFNSCSKKVLNLKSIKSNWSIDAIT